MFKFLENIDYLNGTGLVFSISAAIMLAYGNISVSKDTITRLSSSYMGTSPTTYRALVEQRMVNRSATIILCIGFIMQMTSLTGVKISYIPSSLLIILMLSYILYFSNTYNFKAAELALINTIDGESVEEIYRNNHFSDLTELQWSRLKLNNNINFANKTNADYHADLLAKYGSSD